MKLANKILTYIAGAAGAALTAIVIVISDAPPELPPVARFSAPVVEAPRPLHAAPAPQLLVAQASPATGIAAPIPGDDPPEAPCAELGLIGAADGEPTLGILGCSRPLSLGEVANAAQYGGAGSGTVALPHLGERDRDPRRVEGRSGPGAVRGGGAPGGGGPSARPVVPITLLTPDDLPIGGTGPTSAPTAPLVTPLPAAAWLLSTGLIGLALAHRCRRRAGIAQSTD